MRTSFMSLVLLSLIFICRTCSFFWYRAIAAFSGSEIIMTATPQNAGQPHKLNRQISTSMSALQREEESVANAAD